MGDFLIIIILLAAGWLLLVVPSRRRRAAHAAMQDGVDVGDEVITAGGLHGVVKTVEDELVELEIAPAVVVKLDRRAIAAVATEVEVEPDDEPEPVPEPENAPEPR
ncbi:MAG TPA: preprotein translocase subunit YajC [Gaiellaceae bacterium]|nr:preprotein translocase subunit YajC [Gaiellaceae bacterium]